ILPHRPVPEKKGPVRFDGRLYRRSVALASLTAACEGIIFARMVIAGAALMLRQLTVVRPLGRVSNGRLKFATRPRLSADIPPPGFQQETAVRSSSCPQHPPPSTSARKSSPCSH